MWNGFGFSLPLCTIQFFVSRHVGSPERLMIFLLQIALSISPSARNPVLFMSCWFASFHLVFGRPIFLFLVISVLNTFLVCVLHLSSSHARTSSIASLRSFCVTLVVPLMRLFLVLSLHVTRKSVIDCIFSHRSSTTKGRNDANARGERSPSLNRKRRHLATCLCGMTGYTYHRCHLPASREVNLLTSTMNSRCEHRTFR